MPRSQIITLRALKCAFRDVSGGVVHGVVSVLRVVRAADSRHHSSRLGPRRQVLPQSRLEQTRKFRGTSSTTSVQTGTNSQIYRYVKYYLSPEWNKLTRFKSGTNSQIQRYVKYYSSADWNKLSNSGRGTRRTI